MKGLPFRYVGIFPMLVLGQIPPTMNTAFVVVCSVFLDGLFGESGQILAKWNGIFQTVLEPAMGFVNSFLMDNNAEWELERISEQHLWELLTVGFLTRQHSMTSGGPIIQRKMPRNEFPLSISTVSRPYYSAIKSLLKDVWWDLGLRESLGPWWVSQFLIVSLHWRLSSNILSFGKSRPQGWRSSHRVRMSHFLRVIFRRFVCMEDSFATAWTNFRWLMMHKEILNFIAIRKGVRPMWDDGVW